MTDLEQRIREAYDGEQLPEAVRRRTLSYIEEAREAAPSVGATSRSPSAPTASELSRSADGVVTEGAREVAPPGHGRRAPKAVSRRPRRRPWLAAAACLLLVLCAFGAYGVYRTPSAYVDIDVNPAIELTVNPFGIVIDAEALNDDGRAVLAAVAVTNRPYATAIETLMESEAFAPYASEDSFIDINVVSENHELGETLVAESDRALASTPCGHACQRADVETRNEAAAAGLCVGRYRAAQELMELDPSYTLEECTSMSMRQLRDHIDACHQNDSTEEATPGESGESCGNHGNGHGNGHGRNRNNN